MTTATCGYKARETRGNGRRVVGEAEGKGTEGGRAVNGESTTKFRLSSSTRGAQLTTAYCTSSYSYERFLRSHCNLKSTKKLNSTLYQ